MAGKLPSGRNEIYEGLWSIYSIGIMLGYNTWGPDFVVDLALKVGNVATGPQVLNAKASAHLRCKAPWISTVLL